MKILAFGGSGFIGRYVVRNLAQDGHVVTVFTRGKPRTQLPPSVTYMTGDYKNLPAFQEHLRLLEPEVVLDMLPITAQDALHVANTFRGVARRVVVISSQDVYQAWGYLLGLDPGPVDPLVTENSPLRQSRYPYRGKEMPVLRDWDFENYDKLLVEEAYLSHPDLPATILRLPMVYGPGDYAHRTFAWAKRMRDGRPSIPLESQLARWQGPMGYVEDVAGGIARAVTQEAAAGRVYNIAESDVRSTAQFIRDIGAAVGWEGSIAELPPGSLRGPWQAYRLDQDIIIDSGAIRRELGYRETVPRLSAMRQAIEWELAHPPDLLPAALFNYRAEDRALASAGLTATSRIA